MPKEKFVRQKPKINISDIVPKNRKSDLTTKAALEKYMYLGNKISKGEELGYTVLGIIKKEEN